MRQETTPLSLSLIHISPFTEPFGKEGAGFIISDDEEAVSYTHLVKRAKNVILFIGDGMSLQAREIARILSKGMTNGKYNDLLAMEKLEDVYKRQLLVCPTIMQSSPLPATTPSSPTVRTPHPLMRPDTSP